MIGNFYVVTRATPEERFTAAQDYIAKFPDNACMYNTFVPLPLQYTLDSLVNLYNRILQLIAPS